MLVRINGSTMSQKNFIGPAPSMREASTSSPGMVMKNWRNRKVAVALAISGMISPPQLFSMPRSDTTS